MKIKRSTLLLSSIVILLALSIPALSNASSITDFLASLFRLSVANPQTTVSKFGFCRILATENDKDIFVPLYSEPEWNDFINNPPPDTTLNACGTNCAKIPVSILLTSVPIEDNQTSIPGFQGWIGAPSGVGSTTIDFNWSNGSVRQPLLTSVANYDPYVTVVPFDIDALIKFSDGTSETLKDIAPADGKWHQLPGDWSSVSGRNTCAQGYGVPMNDDYTGFFTQWENLNFPNYTYDGLLPVLRRFTNVSNCENFVGVPNDSGIYNGVYGADVDVAANPNYFFSNYGHVYSDTPSFSDINFNVSNWVNPDYQTTSLYSSNYSPSESQWNLPLNNLPLVIEPTRLVTFSYAPAAYAACSNLINCQTDLIPTHLQFGSISNGVYSTVKVDFSNGTSQTVSNFSTSASWSTLPGDWSTVAGDFGCTSGVCDVSPNGNYESHFVPASVELFAGQIGGNVFTPTLINGVPNTSNQQVDASAGTSGGYPYPDNRPGAAFDWTHGTITETWQLAGQHAFISTGGIIFNAKITFSNGSTDLITNIQPNTNQPYQLPGDWTKVTGTSGCSLPTIYPSGGATASCTNFQGLSIAPNGGAYLVTYGDSSSHFEIFLNDNSGDASVNVAPNYGVYLKHTAAVNNQCVDKDGSIDHKIATADYSFNASYFSSNFYQTSPYLSGWYQFSAVIQGFWGSSTISVPGYATGCYVSNGDCYPIEDPSYTGLPPLSYGVHYEPLLGATYVNMYSPWGYTWSGDPNAPNWWTSYYNAYTEDPDFPVADVIQQQCAALNPGTSYANVPVPPLVVSNGPFTDSYNAGGFYIGGASDGSISNPNGSSAADSPSNPDITKITYSCVDPNDITTDPSW